MQQRHVAPGAPQAASRDRLTPEDLSRWDAIATHPAATAGFTEACLAHPPPGFRTGVIVAHEHGELIAGAPAFAYDFRLDMPLGPAFRALGDRLVRIAPRLLQVPLLCLGSPLADRCALVVDGALDGPRRERAIAAVLDAALARAHETRADVIALKDVPQSTGIQARVALDERGFSRTPSLPVAVLDLPFRSQDEYLASLSPSCAPTCAARCGGRRMSS